MTKVTLSAIGVGVVAAMLFATAGAQEAGRHAPPAGAAVPGRAALAERVRALLAESGVEVGAADTTTPAPARTHRELRITWQADKASPPGPASAQYGNAGGRVALARAAVRREGALPKRRSAELSPTQVVVVALDAEGRIRWCGLVADPRLLRAEVSDPGVELVGQVIYRESAEFVVHYPDDESITEIRLYHPDWDGQKFSLAPLGAVAAR
ncbi:MAG TPA: hypothetical protein VN282_27365 [Pyrinomonadaceae bacterium]|nr:hypothetical protein [Pyrinomonadaceae bacterium]